MPHTVSSTRKVAVGKLYTSSYRTTYHLASHWGPEGTKEQEQEYCGGHWGQQKAKSPAKEPKNLFYEVTRLFVKLA